MPSAWKFTLAIYRAAGRRMCARILTFALLICGCRHTGNFGAAFVQQISHYGGHTQTINAIPELRGTWSIKSDAEGFQAHLSGVSFAGCSVIHAAGLWQSGMDYPNREG